MLNTGGQPIPGLYACGNDAASMSAAEYPGAGCQVGAGLTFGYVAARHAAAGNECPVPYPTHLASTQLDTDTAMEIS